ncbi:anti-sigma factor RsbA family regulatory protein [Actinoplanes sp. NPDC051470]|uniref:anti-sigma factor RsbA family regulatory protein n=1 Tax=Actinoplanes sp. NPDC051470 TaxID=3157224 RepID=UPI0034457829
MRTGAATGHEGYFHESLCYASDEELVAVTVPFLMEGRAAGEPSMVTLDERRTGLIRSALPAGSGVEFLAGGAVYARPATAIHSYRRLLADRVRAGARQIRIVGEVPMAAAGAGWDWWARYESAINHAYNDFPLWSICTYDRRTTPEHMLVEVARTHPRTARPDGTHPPSPAYLDPVTYLSEPRPVTPDRLQAGRPIVDLAAPTPAAARAAIRAANAGVLDDNDLDDLVVAVSEAVTNAMVHGVQPVRTRVWTGQGRMVVAISDAGAGPADPFAGMMPATDRATGGRGLWIVHQSCNHVTAESSPDGYTLRLTAGKLG